MPDTVTWDVNSSPITNIARFHKSMSGDEAAAYPDKVIEPDLTGVDVTQPIRWNGSAVVNLTAGEIQQIADARAAAQLSALKQAAKDIFITPVGAHEQAIRLAFVTVLADVIMPEINILRAEHSFSDRTIAQLDNAFKTAYEARIDALT